MRGVFAVKISDLGSSKLAEVANESIEQGGEKKIGTLAQMVCW